jgi:hypothetical protein
MPIIKAIVPSAITAIFQKSLRRRKPGNPNGLNICKIMMMISNAGNILDIHVPLKHLSPRHALTQALEQDDNLYP